MHKSLLTLVMFGFAALTMNCVLANDDRPANREFVSSIAEDEHLVFFQTSAWLDEEKNHWMVPIHGWVYEPQDSHIRKGIVKKLLQQAYGIVITDDAEPIFSNRVNLLLADNERGKEIVIKLAGRNHLLSATDTHGHFETTLAIPANDLAQQNQNMIRYEAVLQSSDQRHFNGESSLIRPTGKSVISDIDDTVKLSYVTDRPRLIEATFINDFAAVDGMAEIYREWGKQGASFHFVSSSPWQLFSPLKDFLRTKNFPWATMSLKKIRFRDETILDLFKKGTETKPQAIETILQRYPNRSFVLVGDSGEQDAQVYAGIAEKYPEQIEKILIREIVDNEPHAKDYQEIFSKIKEDKWQVFTSPQDIKM